jgi:hypothetical protein
MVDGAERLGELGDRLTPSKDTPLACHPSGLGALIKSRELRLAE